MTASSDQPGKKAVSAPVVVATDPSTGEVDWLTLLTALLHRDGDRAAAGASTDAAFLTGAAGNPPVGIGEEAGVGIGSATGAAATLFTNSQLQPVEVLNGNLDMAWANLRMGDANTLPEIVNGSGLLDGPGFRTVGQFLYFDENGGGVDGTEILFAEYRPTAGGPAEIIFF